MQFHVIHLEMLANELFEKYKNNDITREQLNDALYNLEEINYYFDEKKRKEKTNEQ